MGENKTTVNKATSSSEAPVAQLSPDQNKVIYEELDQGVNPVEIAKKHGFSLGVAERA